MAAIHQQLRIASAAGSLLPRLSTMSFASSFRSALLFTDQSRQSRYPSWSALALALPAALQTIPGILGDIWEGILRAVPKKKTSHMKKRHRLLAGKALKDVTSLNKCPACGNIKKMHTLCPHCMGKIQNMFPNTSKPSEVESPA